MAEIVKGKKAREGRESSSDVGVDPPYWGDPEILKSAGARADKVPKRTAQASVSGRAPDLDMTKDFVAGHDGWPRKVEG